jgi:hypothetical protein
MILICRHCHQVSEASPIPIEPLFTLASAALLIPVGEANIRQLIHHHKDKLQPAIYRRHPRNPKLRVRYLFASDVAALRAVLFSGERFKKSNRKKETT